MRFRRTLGVGIAAAAFALPGAARAADPAAEELRVLVEDLREEVSVLRRKLEVQEETQAAKGPQPLVGAANDGFYLRSADKKYDIRFRGYTHFDGRYFTEDDDDFTDTFIFRRVRPIVEGTLGGVVDFRIMPDFANSTLVLQDAYLNLRYWPLANIQAGKFKAPFGLERLQSATNMLFVERALPTQLVPNRDLGMMVHGNFREGLVQYQLALMNGVSDGASADVDSSDGKELVARLFVHPFQDSTQDWLSGLGLGFAIDYGRQDGGTPAPYRAQSQSIFFSYAAGTALTGSRVRYSPQAYYYWGPFGALAEYVRTSTDVSLMGQKEQFENDAWQLALSYVLTGENASYKGVVPREDVSPGTGGWGAWEIAGRYHELRVDDDVFDLGFSSLATSAERAKAWGVGLNWYMNRWVKIMLNYDRTRFDGGGGLTQDDRDTESVVFLRWQLSY
jgi:phosphate-selective porin OprO/OprP